MRVALISNVNMNPVNRMLKSVQDVDVYETQGYGNELGILLNRESSLYDFEPRMIFVLIDVMELIGHSLDLMNAQLKIDEWFRIFEMSMQTNYIYIVSDAYLYGDEMKVVCDKSIKLKIESMWMNNLISITEKYSNVRMFSYSGLISSLGEKNAFSPKMWYMGKILHSSEFHKAMAQEMLHTVELETRQPKKVLLLDLDNTLWRGLAGEHNNEEIVLSDDGVGLAYKNFQRSIKQLQLQGVILGIVSKNNEADALDIIVNHPHMILRETDFAIMKINWVNKNENIVQIAKELNVGLDSIVFVDDNQAEQMLVRETLKEVIVPDFPQKPEDLTTFIAKIYYEYFEKPVITKEDREKTKQYQSNRERQQLLESSMDFEGYLKSLEMKLIRVCPINNKDRFLQLMNKTNQFNLTTKRFSDREVSDIIKDENIEVFLYKVIDRFGDNGIVAAAIVEFGENALITEFAMSCRVMGRQIENAIVEDMEKATKKRGYKEIIGVYKPTEKNKPVEKLYTQLGYKKKMEHEDGSIEYCISVDEMLMRNYCLIRMEKEN